MSLDVWIFRSLTVTSGCLFCWTSFTGSCFNVWVGQRTDDGYVPSQWLSSLPGDQRKTIRPFPIGSAKTKWLFGAWNAGRDHSPGDQIIQGVLLPSAFSVAPCYYYSTRKPVVILPSHGGWNVESALKVHRPCPRLYIAAAVMITFRGVIRTWVLSHRSLTR